jgi:hypothetical protein
VLWNNMTFPDLMALFGIFALVVGGASLVVSSIPMRSELLARRVNAILPRSAQVSRRREVRRASIVQKLPSLRAGLSEAEQREVIRLFSKIRIFLLPGWFWPGALAY